MHKRVTLTGTVPRLDNTPAAGVVTVMPSRSPIFDTDGKLAISGPQDFPVQRDGTFSIDLPASNDPKNGPAFLYNLEVQLGHTAFRVKDIELPMSETTVDLVDATMTRPAPATPQIVIAVPAGGNDGDQMVLRDGVITWESVEDVTLAANRAEAAAALARDISNITVPDDVVKVLVADGESQTRLALDAWVQSVKAWGVKGDGVTNDTPAFQDAVDAMALRGGGTLYLPAGTYALEAPGIKWASNVSLVGDGPGKSILQQRGDLVDAIHYLEGSSYGDPDAVPLTDVTFRDFEIDGSKLTHTAPSVSGKGIFILYMRRARFENLFIHDTIGTGLGCDFLADTVIEGVVAERCGRNYDGTGSTVGQSGIGIGTHAWEVENVTVSNCHANYNGNHGIFVETQPVPAAQEIWSKGARFVNCYAEGNRHGIANKGSGGTSFIGCEAHKNTKAGFLSTTQSVDDMFIGCRSHENETGFLVEHSLGGVTISGCDAADNRAHGISIVQGAIATWTCNDVTITGSSVRRNGRGGISVDAFHLAVNGVTVVGNRIVDNGQTLEGYHRQGIVFRGTLRDVQVVGNSVGNSSGGTKFQQYGVEVQGATVSNIAVGNNMFIENGTKGYAKTESAPVTNEDIRNNSGQRSSSSGTMTILNGNTSGTAVHGLPEAPSRVIVSARGDQNVWPSTLGTSGVVISRTGTVGDLVVDWIAEI